MVEFRSFQKKAFSIEEIKKFFEASLNATTFFRYFKRRDFSVVHNHKLTILQYINGAAVSYGHLDSADGKTWLGVCVADAFLGKGYGKAMMSHLISFAKAENVGELWLSVDVDNVVAIGLYTSLNFEVKETVNESYYIMVKKL